MPPRTNPFQKLILAIHRALSDSGVKLVESYMFADPVTGEPREIDVALITKVSNVEVVVAVETRDHTRKATVEWIDLLIGKYDRTGYRVVAVSRSGFSKSALAKAASVGIETLTLSDAVSADWAKVVDQLSISIQTVETSRLQMRFVVPVEFAGSWLATATRSDYDDATLTFGGSDETPIPAPDFADEVGDKIDFESGALAGKITDGDKVVVEITVPKETTINKPGQPDIPINQIHARKKADLSSLNRILLSPTEYGGEAIAHGGTSTPHLAVQVIATKLDSDEPLFNISVKKRIPNTEGKS